MGHFCRRDELVKALRTACNLIILAHNDPDGDALGAQLALARGLKSLGKKVRIINVGQLQASYTWLLKEGEAEFYPRSGPFPEDLTGDLIVGLDFNGWGRLLSFGTTIEKSGISTAVIDHHPSTQASADLTYVDTTACATGLIVWEVLQELNVSPNLDIAHPVYVSLITDTGHFRFSSTDRRAHELAGKLIDLGIAPDQVNQLIFESSSLARIRLMGMALKNLQTSLEGRVAWITVNLQEMESVGALPEDTEGFMDIVQTLETLEVGLMFRETQDGHVKVSMRSRGGLDLSEFATSLGGGGHVRAAGATFDQPLDEVVTKVVSALEEQLKNHKK